MRSFMLSLGAAAIVGLCTSSAQADRPESSRASRNITPAVFGNDDGVRIEQVGRRRGRSYGRSYSYRPYYGSSTYYSYPRYGYSDYGPSYGFGTNSYRAYYGAPSYYGPYRSYGYRSYGYRPYGYGYGGGYYGRGYSGRGGVSIGIGF